MPKKKEEAEPAKLKPVKKAKAVAGSEAPMEEAPAKARSKSTKIASSKPPAAEQAPEKAGKVSKVKADQAAKGRAPANQEEAPVLSKGEETRKAKAPAASKGSNGSKGSKGVRKRQEVELPAETDGVESLGEERETQLRVEFTPDAIALRAYFLSEKRRREGRHADPTHDWLQAESELLAEIEQRLRKAKKPGRSAS